MIVFMMNLIEKKEMTILFDDVLSLLGAKIKTLFINNTVWPIFSDFVCFHFERNFRSKIENRIGQCD